MGDFARNLRPGAVKAMFDFEHPGTESVNLFTATASAFSVKHLIFSKMPVPRRWQGGCNIQSTMDIARPDIKQQKKRWR